MTQPFLSLMVAALVLSLSHNAEAQPFGLEMGTPIEALDVREEGSSRQRGFFNLETVPKPHSKFVTYSALANEQLGVCEVIGWGTVHEDDASGTQVQSDFNSVKAQLVLKYGPVDTLSMLFPNAKWGEDNEWVKSIYENERLHSARWRTDDGLRLIDNITSISLRVSAFALNEAKLSLSYTFSNSENCYKGLGSTNSSDMDAL